VKPSRWARLESDRLTGWSLVVLGLLALLLGWIGTSGHAYPAQQLPYILSGGIGGIFALGLGATLLLSADLRDEWRKMDQLADELRQLREGGSASSSGADPGSTPASGNGSRDDVTGTSDDAPPRRRRRQTKRRG
jgi:hypothetical protein